MCYEGKWLDALPRDTLVDNQENLEATSRRPQWERIHPEALGVEVLMELA